MITVRTGQKTYTAVYNRGDAQQPMTSYALGRWRPSNMLTNDVFTMQRRPQFGGCPFCLTALALGTVAAAKEIKGVLDKKAFKKYLENKENYPEILKVLNKLYPGIKDEEDLAKALITIFKGNAKDSMKLFKGETQTSEAIMAALEGEKKLYKWMKENNYV